MPYGNYKTPDEYKRALEIESAQKADELGIPITNGRIGHNDARDAFRHAYSTAIVAFDHGKGVSYAGGVLNEILGDLKGQPPLESRADTNNNRIGLEVAGSVTSRDEIAQKTFDALNQGKLIVNPESGPSPTNDETYIPPADFGVSNLVEGDGMWDRGAENNTAIGDIFAPYLNGKSSGRRGFLRQVAIPTSIAIGNALMKSRQKSLEQAILQAITGRGLGSSSGSRTSGFPDVFSNLLQGIVAPLISRGRTRTSSQESERSVAARQAWNSSDGQQAAMIAQMVQQGARNL